MKLEINLPKFKRPTNPFISEGVKALVIVLGVILLICAAVFVIKLFPKPKSAVLPASTEVETTVPEATEVPTEIQPTIMPQETLEATASSRRNVPKNQPSGEPAGSVNQTPTN